LSVLAESAVRGMSSSCVGSVREGKVRRSTRVDGNLDLD
jgi:hypothetical protein